MKYKIKIIPCSMFDTEIFENWASDMAEKGWALKGIWSLYALFEKCEPKRMKYRLEPKEDMEQEYPKQSEQDMYESFGWDFVCRYSKYAFIWRADEDAAEIHTDTEIQSEIYKKVQKSALKNMIFSLISGVLIMALIIFMWFGGNTPVIDMVESDRSLALVFIFALYPILWFDCVWDYIKVKKLVKRLEAGEHLTHDKKYSRFNFYRVLIFVLLFAAIICTYFLPFYAIYKSGSTVHDKLHAPDFYVMQLDEIEGKGFKYNAKYKYNGQDYTNFSVRNWSPLTNFWYEIHSGGEIFGQFWKHNEKPYEPQMEINHYDLRLGFMADALLDDLHKQTFRIETLDTPEGFNRTEIAYDGIEEGYMLKNDNENVTWVFARNGNRVISVFYRGYADLSQHYDKIAMMVE